MARTIVDAPHDWLNVLTPEECIFVPCLIMTHQENVAGQEQGVAFYNKLEPKLSTELHIFRTIFEELTTVLVSSGRQYTKEKAQQAMDRISGTQNSSHITFEQFTALFRSGPGASLETIVRHRFNQFDTDGSGEISLEELKKCIQDMDDLVTSAEVETMLEVCDSNHNGSVSFEEFLALMTQSIKADALTELTQANNMHYIKEASAIAVTEVG
jgi:Ca2+-binding EF-hand superfamily protein